MRKGRRHPTLSHAHGGSKIGVWWTHELIAYALDRYHRRHLRTPTVRELRSGISDFPSYSTILNIYGSAGNMLRYHGYRVRRRGGQLGHPPVALERNKYGQFLPKPSSTNNLVRNRNQSRSEVTP